MKKIIFLSLIIGLSGCLAGDSKFVRKTISNGDITIKWCYYSYISNTSPDFVEIEKKGERKEIYKATWVITDIQLKDSNIILNLVEPSNGVVYTKQVDKDAYGYNIILDTTGSFENLKEIPDGVKEN